MKEYTRTTHNFNNETRMWEYRGDRGGDKFDQWNSEEVRSKLQKLHSECKWSFGVHGLESGWWMSLSWIVESTIKDLENNATDYTDKFLELKKNDPNYKEIVALHIIREFEYLIELDMVRCRL